MRPFRISPFVFVLLLLCGAIGCQQTDATEDDPVTLDMSQEAFVLSANHLSDTATMQLSCGCAFLLDSVSYAGDTSVIHFTSADTLAMARHSQSIVAWVSSAEGMKSAPDTASITFTIFHTYRGVDYTYHRTMYAITTVD